MAQQLALDAAWTVPIRPVPRNAPARQPRLCAGCRASEARYGFRDDDHGEPVFERPRTLCFQCFRMELTRRQAIADRVARGWNAAQVNLPLENTLESLARRRRKAQMAARRALDIR
jgi:hypothetical protein